jgi:hypothetical protein
MRILNACAGYAALVVCQMVKPWSEGWFWISGLMKKNAISFGWRWIAMSLYGMPMAGVLPAPERT